MGKESGKSALIYSSVALSVLLIDLWTKAMAERHLSHGDISLLPFLHLVLVYNRGVAFGLLSDAPDFLRLPLLFLAPLLAVGITFFYSVKSKGYISPILMGMIAGGALGNLYDRFFLGQVRDFLYLYYGGLSWPAFNLADASISTAIALLLLKSLLESRRG